MRISADELKRRLASEANIANGVEFRITAGSDHRSGRTNTPTEVRDVISTLANVPGVKAVDIAREFGISHQTVSDYKNGKNGGHGSFKPGEKEEKVDKIKDQALTKLMASLGLISDSNLGDLNAKELSSVAVNLARVHSTLSPVQQAGDKVNLIVYSPQLRDESKFNVVEVDT